MFYESSDLSPQCSRCFEIRDDLENKIESLLQAHNELVRSWNEAVPDDQLIELKLEDL